MLIEDKHCRQCQKVLQDQVKKEMEEKEKELSNGGMTEAQESTPKSLNMENIHKSELEKEMITLTPIVANTILPGLLKISEEDLRENVKTLGPTFIELTVCTSMEVRMILKEVLSRVFQLLMKE